MLSPSEGVSVSPPPPRGERRCRYRRPFHNLAYVKLGADNGGILRDISDHGAALQAVAPLEAGQVVQLHFDLLGPHPGAPRRRMDVEGLGRLGLSFRSGWAFGSTISVILPAAN